MTFLSDPRIFNYVLIGLYAVNASRWAFHGSWGDTLYWICAAGITVAVTFGFAR